MLLVVGLGNPGAEYAWNRHNIGFMALDAIVARHHFSRFRSRFHGLVAEGTVDGRRLLALKPQTYMNDSGRSVVVAAGFHRLAPEDILVFHDEIDLAAGKVRVKHGGGHAGHNGLRSIQAHVGADFRRVRLGIGHPGEKDRVTGHVLHDFARSDRDWLEALLAAVAEHFPILVRDDDAAFMSKVALAVRKALPIGDRPAVADDAAPGGREGGDDGV